MRRWMLFLKGRRLWCRKSVVPTLSLLFVLTR